MRVPGLRSSERAPASKTPHEAVRLSLLVAKAMQPEEPASERGPVAGAGACLHGARVPAVVHEANGHVHGSSDCKHPRVEETARHLTQTGVELVRCRAALACEVGLKSDMNMFILKISDAVRACDGWNRGGLQVCRCNLRKGVSRCLVQGQ